jgi:tetratricopeptide (TPR) repeat protein
VAVVMGVAFGIELIGVPGCSIGADQPANALRRVERLIAAREFAAALPLALENRARYPGQSTSVWQLARVYEGLRRPAEEAAAWEAYLNEQAPTPTVCTRLSDVYRQLGQPSQVVAVVDRCLAFDSHLPELLADAAAARIELGDRATALSVLQQAAVIDPGNPRVAALLKGVSSPP